MPSTKTFADVVRSVLRACNAGTVSDAAFPSPEGQTSNAREIEQAKGIVQDCYDELQNDRPDSFWRRQVELRIYPPYVVGGVSQISSGAPATVDFVGGADMDAVPWLAAGNPLTITDTLLNVFQERQFYRVATRQSATQLTTTQAFVQAAGFNDPVNPLGYMIFKFRYAAPANFADVFNLYNAHVGADLERVGPEEMVELQAQYSYAATGASSISGWGRDPTHYAIDRDDTGAYQVILHPLVPEARVLTLKYKAKRSALAAASDVFDLDDPEMPILVNRAKGRACVEIVEKPELATYYHAVEAQQKELAKLKSSESAGMKLTPSTGSDYRDHYGNGALIERERRLFIR